jgi:hypothetical protein
MHIPASIKTFHTADLLVFEKGFGVLFNDFLTYVPDRVNHIQAP